jgi:malate synthase
MGGMKNGELENAGPIGGMAAVMIYQNNDPYGRSRYNPLALRAMVIDKLRERVLGLVFVPEGPVSGQPTLEDILAKKVKGHLYDCYRQSWVASPEPDYVASGNAPLQAPVEQLQSILSAAKDTVKVKTQDVPTPSSGLSDAERSVFESRGLLNAEGKITPLVITKESIDTPEKLLSQERWDAINGVPQGEITVERIQHAFYMAANYGFQILNGNFAAAIDDYELKLRFMNDLATYRIDVTWLWTLLQHKAKVTKDGFLKRPKLTEDGIEPAENADAVKAGTPFTMDLYEKLWNYHNEWTAAFFAEQDKSGSAGRFDRDKANVIMELLMKQLPSPRYIQHSARVLFVMGQANKQERSQLLEAIFDLTREETVKRVQAGTLSKSALAAHDYVFDIFSADELKKASPSQGNAAD